MLVIPALHRDRFLTTATKRLATCWRIVQKVPTGASTFRFTDWPETLVVADEGVPGNTHVYTPVGSFDASARRRDGDGKNFEAKGIISDLLTHDELSSRRFDGAEVTEYLVFVDTAWRSTLSFNVYYIDSLVYDGQAWQAQCSGLSSRIGDSYGSVFSPSCRVEVFSTGVGKCNVNPASFTWTSEIGAIYEDQLYFQGIDLAAVQGFLNDGKILWTSGDNIGIYSDVKSSTEILPAGHHDILLHMKTPLPMQLGDTFTVTAGCNKLSGIGESAGIGHCKHRYNNLVNFQGEPTLPGRDAVLRGSKLV